MSLINPFDKLQNIAKQAKDTVLPPSVRNLQIDSEAINKKLADLESQPPSNNQQLQSITHLRTYLHQHLRHLIDGGHPDPSPVNKSHPIYQTVLGQFSTQQERLAALESQYLRCRFGYKDAAGAIIVPSPDWDTATLKKWDATGSGGRCWLLEDPNRYV